jgi:sugar-specific transcriptional regulator TrmB
MIPPDLTPFGFTPTENLAYGALVELGPSSGYAVAKHLSIARANGYQALDGLVTKGAAVQILTAPKRYRAIQPKALLTQILDAEARKLDRFERQVLALPEGGAAAVVRVEGLRAAREISIRAIVRAVGPARCVAPPAELQFLAPAFRARAAAGRTTEIWSLGSPPAVDTPLAGSADPARAAALFGGPVLLLVADGALSVTAADEIDGYWTSHPLLVGLTEAGIRAITAT